MFVAMNRFRIAPGQEQAFEALWLGRNSQLKEVPGFIAFHLLKGDAAEDHRPYTSHSFWQSRDTFTEWTRSEAFRAAHAGAGDNRHLYLGPPQFEGYEVIQSIAA